MEKELKDMQTSELLEEMNKEEWDTGAFGEVMEREPFNHLSEQIEELKKEVQKLKNKVEKLEEHHHADGKVLYEN